MRVNKHNLTCHLPLTKKSKNPSFASQNLPLHYVVSPTRMILLHQHQGHLRRSQHFKSVILKCHCAHRWLQHLYSGHRPPEQRAPKAQEAQVLGIPISGAWNHPRGGCWPAKAGDFRKRKSCTKPGNSPGWLKADTHITTLPGKSQYQSQKSH